MVLFEDGAEAARSTLRNSTPSSFVAGKKIQKQVPSILYKTRTIEYLFLKSSKKIEN
jgi:hypothetical protein